MRTRRIVSFLILVILSAPAITRAQWQSDGVPLCTAPGEQGAPAIVPDGSGGWIVAFYDDRDGDFSYDIYAQRVDPSGAVLWQANGVPICTATGTQYGPTIVADGAGGAIIAWSDYRGNPADSDIYAQRINAAGVVQWPVNGSVVGAATGEQSVPASVADGAGGAILVWNDYRAGSFDVYAQRINAAGAAQWTLNGVALAVGPGDQYYVTAVTDGAGGAIATWTGGGLDVYAQRVNASGVVQWTANGIALTAAAGNQYVSTMVSDGAGGAIATWLDHRGTTFDVYAQRVNATGVVQWTANGVPICTASSDQLYPKIAPDGAAGAIITWYDNRSGSNSDIYAQRVDALGTVRWTVDGVAVCTAANVQIDPLIASDQAGGAIVTWADARTPGVGALYAQRINASGVAQWSANGVPIIAGPGTKSAPAIEPDGAEGMFAVWIDYRTGTYPDVYAQRIEHRFGRWGHPEPEITSVADIRLDQGGKVKVNWLASDLDAPDLRTITHYSIWRATDAVAALAASSQGMLVKSPSEVQKGFKGRAVWAQHVAATDYYWEWVGNEDAHYRSAYTFSAPTRSDSTIQSTANEQFFVSAHTSDAFVFYDSNVKSGHSVDNLAPLAPLGLIAQRTGWTTVKLRWNRVHAPDLHNYSVYRKTSTGVTPVPANFLANATDTVLTDSSVPTSGLYYIVTATDVHGNQSKVSNEAAVVPASGAGNTPALTALSVLQNHPNPFTGTTELEIGLPSRSDISVDVYDVAGRRVMSRVLPGQKAGWQRFAFDGRDDAGRMLSSGVYFFRVSANRETLTRKIMITR